MRRSSGGAVLAALALVATAVTVVVSGPPFTSAAALLQQAAPAEPYTWKNVRIDGGGFVPGIVFNPGEQNLIYARTDIGGAYRWNQSAQSWTPLLDWVGQKDWGYNGVLSIATDPVDTRRVYAAAGMYTNSWDPNNGAILRSTDRGATWHKTVLPFKIGGNMPGRGMGERLVVDPRNNRNVYFAAEGGNGLWRSTDHGVTWAKVSAFPNAGNYVADPSDTSGYQSQNQGLSWVTFDPASTAVYVGVADKENPVYRSLDSGATWERIAGQPTGYLAHKGVIQGKYLFIATSDTGGPYDGGAGQVARLDTETGVWTDISPTPVADRYYGYSGLTVDRQKPGTLMVATQISWWPDAIFFRSTDYGATWTRVWDWSSYPSRTKRYTMDISANPWLDFNSTSQAPEESPKLGWMNESLEIDPFDSDRLLYGTGATLYGTTQLTNWDSGSTFTIKPFANGIEETAVQDLASPPTGAPLVSALYDVGGFHHADLDAVPANFHDTPSLGSNTGLDFAELSPSFFVRVGNAASSDGATVPHIGISNDGGKNWYQGQEPSGVTGGGTVAVGADANAVVWSPAGVGVHYSTTRGSTWSASTGIPAGAKVESDRVNPKTFYGYAAGKFYLSTDGGATFTTSAAAMPAEGRVNLKAVPGVAGEVWLAGSTGLLRSTDSGRTFTAVPTVTSGINVAFGKAAPGASTPAVFLAGTVDGVDGVFRSDNNGSAWVRINDDAHQYGNAGDALAGDPRVYGRVYLGTNGRGILYADRNGGPSSPTPSASSSPSPPSPSVSVSSSPSSSPSSTPSVSPSTGSGCTATYRVTGQWTGGFQGEVIVKNNGTAATTGWTVTWAYTGGQVVTQSWGGTATQSGTAVTVVNAGYNGALSSGASTTFGFLGSNPSTTNPGTTNPVPSPVACTTTP
ncbi:cellulose binding domain-containing protein [Actinoplanes sp. CA-015351]|uniref:cellulose binding domain-containing protein n=1 Tax=Actinoplanes sp. CA-015351 TaxID=3239897 RepID=UPI003D996F2D